MSPLNSRAMYWFVGYTFPRSEKKLSYKLDQMGVESFLPTRKVLKQWSDRKKMVEEPLFTSYIFIKTTFHKCHELTKMRELVTFVSQDRRPTVVPDEVINSLMRLVCHNVELEHYKGLVEGQRVLINDGQFHGIEGILIQSQNRNRLIIQIEALNRQIAVYINAAEVSPV